MSGLVIGLVIWLFVVAMLLRLIYGAGEPVRRKKGGKS
jgi:hypothetical protein